jgi:hypothetical protein
MATARSKFYTKSQVVFTLETAGNIETLRTSGAPKTAMGSAIGVVDAYNVNLTQVLTNLSQESIIYINTNKHVVGTYVSPTTATFPAGFLTAPINLPATSIDNFIFFCNGQFIEKTALVNFTQSGNVSTLVINPTTLQYGFEVSDEIIAIGKFA